MMKTIGSKKMSNERKELGTSLQEQLDRYLGSKTKNQITTDIVD